MPAKWDMSKDKQPIYKKNVSKNPMTVTDKAKAGTKVKRNEIGQFIGR